jgi:hypothetical protein
MDEHPEAGRIKPFQLHFAIGVSGPCVGEGKGSYKDKEE